MEKREINILLLGKTGVGKSTWINGFANYLTYDTLSEAQHSKKVCLIPVSFVMTDGETFKEKTVIFGPDDHNEVNSIGQSSTQEPKSYVFQTADATIRLIDTPGIGDTRGIQQDKANMQRIMTHLSNYASLHGILILLKPNDARLDVMFMFCIKELLANLHIDACRNIILCFTNARSTLYRPGDTLPALRRLVAESSIPINISKPMTYFIDNESFRFLATLESGEVFNDDERATFENSWKTSVTEIQRMMHYIAELKPHLIGQTLSLNKARKLILDVSRPMAEISATIQQNIDEINSKKQEEIKLSSSKLELETRLYIPSYELQVTTLEYPTTVCAGSKCVQTVEIGGVSQQHYVQRCHEKCTITTGSNIVGSPGLENCEEMEHDTGMCHSCGCPWYSHMHITYDIHKVKVKKIDPEVKYMIDDKEALMKQIENFRSQLQDEADALQGEMETIAKVGAACACFLKKNAIIAYNDAVIKYLEYMIRGEEESSRSMDKLQGLKSLQRLYSTELETLQTAIDANSGAVPDISPAEIEKRIQLLYELPKSGPMFRQTMQAVDTCNERAVQHSEKVVDVKKRSLWGRVCSAVKHVVVGDDGKAQKKQESHHE